MSQIHMALEARSKAIVQILREVNLTDKKKKNFF